MVDLRLRTHRVAGTMIKARKLTRCTKIYTLHHMSTEKPIYWVGTSYQDLLSFSVAAKQQAGYQLHRIQNGLEPDNWKPLSTIGAGVKEIRIKEKEGIYRIIYVAKLKNRIYVLHAFQKKTQKIRKQDIDIAKVRYSAISQENST